MTIHDKIQAVRVKRDTKMANINFDAEVLNAVDETAKAQKRNRSSLVNWLCHSSLLSGQKPPEEIAEPEQAKS